MSRIHQALKKAQQERANNSDVEVSVPEFSAAPAATATLPPAPVEPSNSILAPPRPGPLHGDFLRYDDLRNRCTSVRWHFDPKIDVFYDPSGTAPGAEQFRTLRSRLYQ